MEGGGLKIERPNANRRVAPSYRERDYFRDAQVAASFGERATPHEQEGCGLRCHWHLCGHGYLDGIFFSASCQLIAFCQRSLPG
jgi:hypothetical protein